MRIPAPPVGRTAFPTAPATRLNPLFTLPFTPGRTGQTAEFTPRPRDAGRAEAPGRSAEASITLGLTSAAMGFYESALKAFRDATEAAPGHAQAWRKLAEMLRFAGKDAEAEAAQATAERCPDHAASREAAGERSPARIDKAERKLRGLLGRTPEDGEIPLVRDQLFNDPTDVAAMRLLAMLEWRAGDALTAQTLLARALELSPIYTGARADYTEVLMERRQYVLAYAQAGQLVASAPRDLHYRSMLADALGHIGDFGTSLAMLEGMIGEKPRLPRFWLAYANALRSVGRREDSARAYRTCLELAPATGEAYFGLSDLKGRFLTETDVAAMRAQLAGSPMDTTSRMHVFYALAHTLERSGEYEASFAAYENGARAFRDSVAGTPKAHDMKASTERVRRLKTVFTAANFAARPRPADAGAPADTPIFVVGMPRAGSTLVEQILASHSMVEGTRELPVVGEMVRELTLSRRLVTQTAYPDRVLELTPDELAALGTRYITQAAAFRTTQRAYFIDKRPWNWMDAGLIHLMLPQARIVDVRRAPMAACFAMFKQLLPTDAAFSYDLQALGRYYNDYVGMMDHYDKALPGRIHYVSYERLVEDTETEIRRLLAYCGLPFEAQCLRFWENDRAIATPSAEQVRRPIFRDALQQWRHFEPWLGPLDAALRADS